MDTRTESFKGHTPGPWWASDHGPLSGNIIRAEINAGDRNSPITICEVPDSAIDTESDIGNPGRKLATKKDAANIALLAAAPTLLAQRDRLAECLRNLLDQQARCVTEIRGDVDKWITTANTARAALAELEAE